MGVLKILADRGAHPQPPSDITRLIERGKVSVGLCGAQAMSFRGWSTIFNNALRHAVKTFGDHVRVDICTDMLHPDPREGSIMKYAQALPITGPSISINVEIRVLRSRLVIPSNLIMTFQVTFI